MMTVICPNESARAPAIRELKRLSTDRRKDAVQAACIDQPPDCSAPEPSRRCQSPPPDCNTRVG